MEKNFEVLISAEAKSFIKSLDVKVQKKIAYNIQKAREINDPKLFKKLNSEIWEFRTNFDRQQIRLLGFWDPTQKAVVICTHGFVKKTQKTPKSQIDKAINYRTEYLKK